MSRKPFFRLAFRVEGENWNAYYAHPTTMDGAVYLGSIKMSLVRGSGQRREQFLVLMRECFGDVCEKTMGVRPEFDTEIPAPQHERSSNA